MTMFDCPYCHDRHHVNDFCATGPMSLSAALDVSQPGTQDRNAGRSETQSGSSNEGEG